MVLEAQESTPASTTEVTFCAPDKDVYPFFMTRKNELSGFNPDMLAQIFTPENLPDASLNLVRRPWKRCNKDLHLGTVDMMIGGYDPSRESVVYPDDLGFDMSDSVVSTANVCFFSLPGQQKQRTRKGMDGNGVFVVGIEAGFSKRHSAKMKPRWVELFNPIEKYRLLQKGRLDAIIQVCAMDGQPINTVADRLGFRDFEMLYPPYLSNPAYVVFSQKFAEQNADLAKRIVRQSVKIDKTLIYSRYKAQE